MNTMNFLQCSSSSAISHVHNPYHQHSSKPISLSPPNFAINPRNSSISSYFNQNKKKSKKKTQPEKNLIMIVDIEEIRERARLSIHRFFDKTERKINNFVSSGSEAIEDLKTLVTIDYDNRVIVSCKRSSLEFLGNFLLWGFLIFIGVRVLMDLEVLGFSRGGGFKGGVLWKRDRSLAGKEVVVGKRKKKEYFKFSVNPLTPAKDTMRMKNADQGYSAAAPVIRRSYGEKKVPKWWPEVKGSSFGASVSSVAESQKEAEIVMRAIMDNRMSGKDISEDDIIQFRRTCKNSGAKVLVETTNARDSFYRASVELVLNSCSRSTHDSAAILIGGENPQDFVAGIAFNLGLDTVRAARIVSASVASRTRSWFLQAWALEMQGKHAEAVDEISKICLIHQIFPPEESSAEMEMVARGLEKHLRREQREFLLDLCVRKCDAGSRRSAAEALGLVSSALPVQY